MANICVEGIDMIGMWGEVEIRTVKDCVGINDIIHKYTSGIPMCSEERRILDQQTTFKNKQKNMLMTRFIDRFCGITGHSPTVYFESTGKQYDVDDYNMMPYFLIGVGIARLNNSWETKKKF